MTVFVAFVQHIDRPASRGVLYHHEKAGNDPLMVVLETPLNATHVEMAPKDRRAHMYCKVRT
jgi:hypothetical protein